MNTRYVNIICATDFQDGLGITYHQFSISTSVIYSDGDVRYEYCTVRVYSLEQWTKFAEQATNMAEILEPYGGFGISDFCEFLNTEYDHTKHYAPGRHD